MSSSVLSKLTASLSEGISTCSSVSDFFPLKSTKNTPQSSHDVLSAGINDPQAPHSPITSSDIPPITRPQSAHDVLSSGIIESHAPH